MNIILNPLQSDTKLGDINLLSNADLTGKEGYLLKIINEDGVPEWSLPAAIGDLALFICASGDVAANPTFAEAPFTGGNARVQATGTIEPGDVLILDADNWGAVISITDAAPGQYFSPGIAEEAATTGGLIKFRPLHRLVGVKAAQTQTALTDNSTGTASTTLAALVNAVAASTDATASQLTSVNAGFLVLKNAIASLAAELALVKADVAALIAD